MDGPSRGEETRKVKKWVNQNQNEQVGAKRGDKKNKERDKPERTRHGEERRRKGRRSGRVGIAQERKRIQTSDEAGISGLWGVVWPEGAATKEKKQNCSSETKLSGVLENPTWIAPV